jgi:hypothetical protein
MGIISACIPPVNGENKHPLIFSMQRNKNKLKKSRRENGE